MKFKKINKLSSPLPGMNVSKSIQLFEAPIERSVKNWVDYETRIMAADMRRFEDTTSKVTVLDGKVTNLENEFTPNYFFKNIESLKKCNWLLENDIVYLEGFYSAGDKGSHKRIVEKTSRVGGVVIANGLYANVIPVNSTISVNWFGSKRGIDSTQSFLDCFGYANARYSDSVVSKVVGNQEQYIINKTISIIKAVTVDLNNSTLDFENCVDSVGVRIFSSGAVNSYPNMNNLSVSNIKIGGFSVVGLKNGYKGFFTSDMTDTKLCEDNFLFKKGFTGVLVDNASLITLDRIAVHACEKGIDYSTNNVYIVTTDNCSTRFCKYGIYIDYNGKSNSNERMTFTNSNFGNNYASLAIRASGFHFINCSFDYERYISAPELPLDTSIGGTQNGIGAFTSCWFEDVKSNKDYKFYTDKSVLSFSQCYFIQPSVKYFIKAESENALATFDQCHFGASSVIAPYKQVPEVDPWQVPKVVTRFCTYHKFWSEVGAFKKLQAENLVSNGYLVRADESFSDWSPNDGLISDDKRWEYSSYNEKKSILCRGAMYKGAQICSHLIPVQSNDVITVRVESNAPNNVVTFFRQDMTAMQGYSNIFLSMVGNTRYLKPYMVPQGACYMQVKVKSQGHGEGEQIHLVMMEVFKN